MVLAGGFWAHPRALRSVEACRELTLGRPAAQHRAPCADGFPQFLLEVTASAAAQIACRVAVPAEWDDEVHRGRCHVTAM